MAKKQGAGEIEEVERYEYLLVEYLKEMSNEMAYLLMATIALFLFVLLDVSVDLAVYNLDMIKLVLIAWMVGSIAMFSLSSLVKWKIEKKFKKILS
jgi:hypothetical protein